MSFSWVGWVARFLEIFSLGLLDTRAAQVVVAMAPKCDLCRETFASAYSLRRHRGSARCRNTGLRLNMGFVSYRGTISKFHRDCGLPRKQNQRLIARFRFFFKRPVVSNLRSCMGVVAPTLPFFVGHAPDAKEGGGLSIQASAWPWKLKGLRRGW